jgi:hypothetical protein
MNFEERANPSSYIDGNDWLRIIGGEGYDYVTVHYQPGKSGSMYDDAMISPVTRTTTSFGAGAAMIRLTAVPGSTSLTEGR